jgi:hypothetical protein
MVVLKWPQYDNRSKGLDPELQNAVSPVFRINYSIRKFSAKFICIDPLSLLGSSLHLLALSSGWVSVSLILYSDSAEFLKRGLFLSRPLARSLSLYIIKPLRANWEFGTQYCSIPRAW